MNTENINNKSLPISSMLFNDKSSLIENLKKGKLKENEVINGKIKTKEQNDYIIELDTKENFKAPASSILGEIGDLVSFKVVSKNKLRQVFNNSPSEYTSVLAKQSSLTDLFKTEENYSNFLNQNKHNDKENFINIYDLKNDLSKIANESSTKLDDLIKTGLNPKKLDTLSFSDFLSISTGVDTENKEPKHTKTLMELKKDKEKYMKMDLNMNGLDEESLFRFEQILENSTLPKTQKNLETLTNIRDKFENIKNLDDEKIISIVKNGKKATVHNLYSEKHSGSFSPLKDIQLDDIENLNTQIENIFKAEGISTNSKTLDIAKNFIKNDLEINFNNFNKFQKLKDIKNKSLDTVLVNVLNDKEYDFTETTDRYQEYKKLISNIEPEHIQLMLSKNTPINLANIYRDFSSSMPKDEVLADITPSIQALNEKLNLAKIQMKLTLENIYSLSKNNIAIDTKPLQKVIEDLEFAKNNSAVQALKISQAPLTSENINITKNTNSIITSFYPSNVYKVFKDIISKDIDFSLKGIDNAFKAKGILENLETFKTKPSKLFGDNINKMQSEFENFLRKNNFNVTNSNLKSLKILALNEIDFNEENIIKTKTIDAKLNYIHNNLNPVLVGKMLKNNFNPLENNIDEVINYMDTLNLEIGLSSREKIAEQILKLDAEHKISKEEKDAILSIYKMLNLIERDGSASIGNILKSEKNLTFKNLLEASKIYNSKKKNIAFDKLIGDNNELVQTNIVNNITTRINEAFEKINYEQNTFSIKQALNNLTIKDIAENMNSEKTIDDIANMHNKKPLEDLSYLRNLDKVDNATLDLLIKNNMPITINNIKIADDILKDDMLSDKIEDFKHSLSEYNIDFAEFIPSFKELPKREEILKTLNKLSLENDDAFDNILELDNLDDIKLMILKNKNLASGIKFLKDNNSIENGLYSLPIKLSSGKITDFNMFVLNNKALSDKNLNIYIDYKNADNNRINANIKISENGKNATVFADENTIKNIQNKNNDIFTILEKFNVDNKNIKFCIAKTNNLLVNQNKINLFGE